MSLKTNTNGALIRNALTGALCSTCCAGGSQEYVIFNGLIIPLAFPNQTWGGYYWRWEWDGFDEYHGWTYFILKRSNTNYNFWIDGYRKATLDWPPAHGVYSCWEQDPEFGGYDVDYKYGPLVIVDGVASEP
jgi:hypothetical protein